MFQVGEWKGIPFTEQDLDDAVANYHKFSTGENRLIDPSLGIGHKREDVLGDGKPRYGTPANLRKEKMTCSECGGTKVWKGKQCPYCDRVDGKPLGTQTFLTADFEETPEEIGHWIKNRQFTHCSAEFYPQGSPRIPNIPTKGISLAGVVLLGKTAPAVKTLPSLRKAEWETYSDLDCPEFCFSEREFSQESSMLVCMSEIMPKGTRVEKCVEDMKAKGGSYNPYAVCQASTHQNLKTGKKITHNELHAHLLSRGLKISQDGEKLHLHHTPQEIDEKLADHEYGYNENCMTYSHPETGYKFSMSYAEPKLGTGQRFEKLEGSLKEKGAKNPGALAAYIGRKKYGAEKFNKLEHHKHSEDEYMATKIELIDALVKDGLDREILQAFSEEALVKLAEKVQPKVIVFNEMMMGDAYKHLTGMGFHAEPSHLHNEGRKTPKETIKLHHGMRDVHRMMMEHGYKHHGGGKFVHHTTGHEYHIDHDHEGMPHVHKFSEVTQGDSDMTPEQMAKMVDDLVAKKLESTLKTFSDNLETAKNDLVTIKSQAALSATRAMGETRLHDLQRQGKIPASWFDNSRGGNIVDFFCELDEAGVFAFSENGQEKKLSVRDKFLEFAESLPARTFDPMKVAGDISGKVGGDGTEESRFMAFSEGCGYTTEKAKEAWNKIKTLPEETRKQALVQLEFDAKNRSAA